MRYLFALLLVFGLLASSGDAFAICTNKICKDENGKYKIIKEPSGIAYTSDGKLLVVDDEDNGKYYQIDVETINGKAKNGPIVLNDNCEEHSEIIYKKKGKDLESIEAIAIEGGSDIIIALSETNRSLVTKNRTLFKYNKGTMVKVKDKYISTGMKVIGNRGLEGLAIKEVDEETYHVAVLWEGGYPDEGDLIDQLADGELTQEQKDVLSRKYMEPKLWIHDLTKDFLINKTTTIDESNNLKKIKVKAPLPSGDEPYAQRFRTTDLVWCNIKKGNNIEPGFIMLLVSENSRSKKEDIKRNHRYLQRFIIDGNEAIAIEPEHDLDDTNETIPASLKRGGKNTTNWEGLDWVVEGEQLALVFDLFPKDTRATAVIIDMPEGWCVAPKQEATAKKTEQKK